MQARKNITAAIMAAIGLYLEAEGQAAVPVAEPVRPAPAPGPAYSPWAMSGRQSSMDMRRFLQMRLAR